MKGKQKGEKDDVNDVLGQISMSKVDFNEFTYMITK